MTAKNPKTHGAKVTMECSDCETRFETTSFNPRCPKCHSWDVEYAAKVDAFVQLIKATKVSK